MFSLGRHAQGLLSVLAVLKLHGAMRGYAVSKRLPAWRRSDVYRSLHLLVKYGKVSVSDGVYGLKED